MNIARRDLLAATLSAPLISRSSALAAAPLKETPAQPQEPKLASPRAGWKHFDAKELGVEGRGWSDVEDDYDRFPARAKETVRKEVWGLSKDTAGLLVSFETDATEMSFDVEITGGALGWYHFSASGKSGLDLYAREGNGPWRWVAASRPEQRTYSFEVSGLRPGEREYRLYLPLYNRVGSLMVNVPESASFRAIPPRTERPIVYYGTSIAQGASASRPGMAFVSILGRRLDVPMINLGFSGNGRLEMEVAQLIAELDARMFVLDCLPNLGPAQVSERTIPVVEHLRSKWPETPIVMVEDRTNANAWILPGRENHHAENHRAFRACYEQLLEAGTKGLTYVADAPFLGDDGEATVDGSHPTDLGMLRYADALEPILKGLLG